jgi:hypothetical protein
MPLDNESGYTMSEDLVKYEVNSDALAELNQSLIAKAIEEATGMEKTCCACNGRLQDMYGYRCKHCSGSGLEPKSCDRVDVKK